MRANVALNTPESARVLWRGGNREEAIEEARAALARGRGSSAAWFQYGMWLLKSDRKDAALEAFKSAYDVDPANLRSLELMLDFSTLSRTAREQALDTLLSRAVTTQDLELNALAVQIFALHHFVPGLRAQMKCGDAVVRAVACEALRAAGEEISEPEPSIAAGEQLRRDILRALSRGRCDHASELLAQCEPEELPPALALRLCLRGSRDCQDDAARAALALTYLRHWPDDVWVQTHIERAVRTGHYDPDHSDELTAYQHFARTDQLGSMSLTTLRQFYRALQSCGYLEQANRVLGMITARSRLPTDQMLLDRRGQDLMVLRGQWEPPAPQQILTPAPAVPDRVLHVVGKSLPKSQAGYTLRTSYIVQAQREMGLDPHVFCQPGEGSDVVSGTWLTARGIPHYFHPAVEGRSMALRMDAQVHHLRAVAQEIRPAVLHAHSDFLNGWVAHVVGTELGIPVVYESRGFWEESWMSRTLGRLGLASPRYFVERLGMPSAYTLRAERERWVRERADRVVTLARVMRTHIVSAGLDPSRVHLVPNAVDTDQFPLIGSDPALRDTLTIPHDAIVLGYISSLMEYEGIETLIRAAAGMEVQRDVHVLIVGDGPERDRLRRVAEAMSGPTFHFTGVVPHTDITRYYAVIDIFVVPRRDVRVCHLVTPLKPFEALSSGCCTVLSDVVALREIADDSGGIIPTFRSDDVADLTEVLQALTLDDARRHKIADAGARWVREHRSWSAVTAEYHEVYGELGLDALALASAGTRS
ncbi:MAG: glycosyltransferase [Ornithinimicrobium sp.]